MRGHFDFRRSRPGHRYRLIENADGEIESFRYQISSIVSYALNRTADGEFSVEREEAELWPREARIAGTITSSLYGAITDLGVQGQLANDFSDVFAYDVDFSRMVRAGDEFHIVYERLFRIGDDGEETFVRTGRILAARYDGASGEHTALYYEPEEGRGAYYRPDGSSVERQFLMAPLQFTRVSSRYSNARRHPILNTTRPHHGIDYAAPLGTPVYAVSSGEVIYKSRAGGFGNLVKIRHSNGYVSYYAHLSRFASGMQIGQTVSQKQVIGFVGSTGLSTGPHVCFRVAKNGQYINPAQIASPAGPPIPEENTAHFQVHRDTLLAELDLGRFAASGEAL
jgi:murein DD-endopeptidase MepM/ murein hydrolase activator NlpD